MKAEVLVCDPVIFPVANMEVDANGVAEMADWIQSRRPECMPEGYSDLEDPKDKMMSLFPHDGTRGDGTTLSGNELLVELAGRACYYSFGERAGRKSNAEYIENTQHGRDPHLSIMYHAKNTYFVGGVSRRVSHELIRHYVGADRTEEGSPSQESTRYVQHAGRYVAHPYILDDKEELERFQEEIEHGYSGYLAYIERHVAKHQEKTGKVPQGMARKRIYESASALLHHSCETSFLWTVNPVSASKMIRERTADSTDLEFIRLASKWRDLMYSQSPNVYGQPWMRAKSE